MLTKRTNSVFGARPHGGQALIMVTISLLVMFGMLGLAVDLGWEFYVHKTAQAAGDAVALAAVRAAKAGVLGMTGPYACNSPSSFTCQPTPVNCGSATGSLAAGCQYAALNDFADGGLEGRQSVLISSNTSTTGCDKASPPNCVPTAPGVAAAYWVHVVTTETVPQIFSGIFGNTLGTVRAESTAALLSVVTPGSIILLDREYDKPTRSFPTGVNLYGAGSEQITAPGGVILASNPGEPPVVNNYLVGETKGSATVNAPYTYIRGTGKASWSYQGGFPDYAFFQDPESGKGQPSTGTALATANLVAVPSGILTATQCPGNVCAAGIYYSTAVRNGVTVATGDPILVNGDFNFGGSTFSDFLFFGGVQFKSGSTTLGPGRYVLAGAQPGNPVLDIGNSVVNGGVEADAGRIFILTDSSYGGDATLSAAVNKVPNKQWTSLGFGDAWVESGNGTFSLYGLNKDGDGVPSELQNFRSVVMWQDQRNSTVLYDANGYVRNSPDCGGDGADRACPNLPSASQVIIKGGTQSVTTTIAGIVYQPRGASAAIDANTNFNGSLALITGAIEMKGSATLTLAGDGIPITTLTSALVH